MDVVVAQGVTKTYRTGIGRARVRELLPPPLDGVFKRMFPRWWSRDTFLALQDVSLSVPAGSSIGIVGHNGAGKTTLLKVISGVTAPSAGRVAVRGRMGALLDVMVGFHPELTGRENVYLLSAMHGLGRRAVDARIEQILEFAEIDDQADTPLKRYSAGMAGRLGFAALTALDFETLLIDEVLAVGDASFQRKCVQWLEGFRSSGGTLLFVSHNLALVRNTTERAVWLDHGRLVDEGPTGDLLGRYARALGVRESTAPARSMNVAMRSMRARGMNRWGAGGARVEKVSVGEPSANGKGLEVLIEFEADGLEGAVFCVAFADEAGREIGGSASPPMPVATGRGVVRCAMHPLPLRTGVYFPIVAILSVDGVVRDRWKLDRAVVVDDDGRMSLRDAFGPFDIAGDWSTAGAAQ